MNNRRKVPYDGLDEKIYQLREQNLSYELIVTELRKQGIKVSASYIRERCKIIYAFKRKEEPILKSRTTVKGKASQQGRKISDEEIFDLREKGYSYGLIAVYFQRKGIKVSASYVGKICKKMYDLKGKKEPKANNKSELEKLEEKLQNVAETKKETGSLLNGYQNLEERLQTQEEVGEQK